MESGVTDKIRRYLRGIKMYKVRHLDRGIERTFGVSTGGNFIDRMNRCFDEQEARLSGDWGADKYILREQNLVQLTNMNTKLSLLCAGFYDWEVLPLVLERVCKYQEKFGSNILDIGCGNGIVDGFLGKELPGASITGTDLSVNALGVAKRLCSQQKLSNVQIVQPILVRKQAYDTVCSIRVAHENTFPLVPDREGAAEYCRTSMREYASFLTSYMQDKSTLFAFERIITKENWQVLVEEYEEAGLYLLPKTYEYLECQCGDEPGVFQFGIFERRVQNPAPADV